jgi:hypothetical protein
VSDAAEPAGIAAPRNPHNEWFWMTWAVIAAFGTYFCMYAFRKPFTAALFEDESVGGIAFKTVLVISQVAGYMVSKFLGIKVISEMPPHRRPLGILLLIGWAELALLLFGVTPRPWNAVWLFANGLSLGMVFGLVLGFLEGRRVTEALTAGLCCSFILADGVTKSLGTWLLNRGVSEDWMPFAAGLIFLPPLGLFVAMLARVPAPTVDDKAARAERAPMTRDERWGLYGRYALGLSLLVVMYLLITILRSIRADFAPELWRGLGATAPPAIFTQSEMFVALGVCVVNGALVCIRDNRRAFFGSLGVCGLGLGLMTVATLGWQRGGLGGFPYMVLIGLGLYLPYVAVHTTVFERFLAMTRDRGNIGFLMYVADAIGYLGYVAVMLSKNFGGAPGEFVPFFLTSSWIVIGLSAVCLLLGWWYFAVRCPAPQVALAPAAAT